MGRVAKALLIAALLALPALAAASGGEAGGANPWMDLVLKFVNFAILVAVFIYVLRKPIPQALSERRENIAKELAEAKEAKEEAEAKLAEFKAKVANLEAEAVKIREDFKAEGERQRERIIEQAKKSAETIRANAAKVGEREAKMAAEKLKNEAVAQALALAKELLAKSYGDDDQARSIEQAIDKIEGLH
ncbi:MAG: hypothetical protein C0609_01395 [Deltaproteobacteria bacterium]|nr:MAG: hypothetical protein C0609_01395 [Deltaproteobacteria bacterium]